MYVVSPTSDTIISVFLFIHKRVSLILYTQPRNRFEQPRNSDCFGSSHLHSYGKTQTHVEYVYVQMYVGRYKLLFTSFHVFGVHSLHPVIYVVLASLNTMFVMFAKCYPKSLISSLKSRLLACVDVIQTSRGVAQNRGLPVFRKFCLVCLGYRLVFRIVCSWVCSSTCKFTDISSKFNK